MSSLTNPYADAHLSPSGAGDARPTALQVIQDEGLVNKLVGKVMLVTGASSGIGIDAVAALHATGADVYMQVRDMKKGKTVLENILASSEGTGKIDLIEMELGLFESIRTGVADFLEKSNKLNVLVNNAGRYSTLYFYKLSSLHHLLIGTTTGVRNTPEGRTSDGFETQFGINHLGHFLLFQLLRPTLLASSSPSFNSRVVNVTSGAHARSQMHFDNLNLNGMYDGRLAYAQSKTANILMANEIDRLYGASGLHGLSVHPGCIRTGLQRHNPLGSNLSQELLQVEKNSAQGAATQVWAAVGKVWEGKGAKYLEDMREGQPVEKPNITTGGYKAFVFDEGAMKKLWQVSCEMVGVSEKV